MKKHWLDYLGIPAMKVGAAIMAFGCIIGIVC